MIRLVRFDTSASYKGFKTFDCGNSMINTFVQKSLKKRVKKHLSQAYILLDDEHFIGFYTLDTFSIVRDTFDADSRPTGFPPIVPVVKLGMLGVSTDYQGIGKRLLRDAFLKVIRISELAGCAGIYLLAEQETVSFYESLGFVGIRSDVPMPMFLSIENIRDAYRG